MSLSFDSAALKLEELRISCPYLSTASRSATFNGHFQRIGFSSRVQIANAGWYWNDANDSPYSVKCPFCLVEVVLNPEDDPWVEHITMSPDCEFVTLGKLSEDNWTGLETITLALRFATMEMYEITWTFIEKLENGEELERHGDVSKILLHLRNSSKYLTYEHRLASFKNFGYDKVARSTCTSKKLARAGWLSTAKQSSPFSAKCPFCLLELEFDATDNPWEEHTTRSPECYFVKIGLDERKWKPNEALLLSVRCAVMKEYQTVYKLIVEMEAVENWSDLKKLTKILTANPKRKRSSL